MPPLLLLCGLLCDETVWGDIPRRLVDVADVRILSFQGFTSVFAMADHVLRTAPARFAVAGHSMGGRVALELVRRAPRRVAGIALLNSGVHPARAGEAQSRGQLVQLARAEGMRALAAAWLPPMMGAPPERVAVLMPRLIKMVERSTPDGFAGQIDALLLSGTNDNWSTLAQHKEMQRGVAHATLVQIEDAGHMAPAEQPAAVANALRSWLALI